MANKRIPNLVVEDAQIRFRNFSGAEGRYNREGDRNFCLLLDPDAAEQMDADGWNVKFLKPLDEGDTPRPYIEVSVNFKSNVPPNVVMITSRGRTRLSEDEVMLLDWADIRTVDLTINPYYWEVNGKTGIKAYLKSIFVTIEEDALDLKYANVPDTAQSAMATRDGEVGADNPPWS